MNNYPFGPPGLPWTPRPPGLPTTPLPGYALLPPPGFNPGPDERMRELERQAAETDDPGLGYQLYRARKQAGLLPQAEEPGEYYHRVVLDTDRGRLNITVTDSDHLHVENRAKDRYSSDYWADPWVINRIPFTFSQHAKRTKGKWVVDVSPYGIYREGGGSRWEPSSSFRKKFKAALEKILNEWSKKDTSALRAGDLRDVTKGIRKLEEEVAELQAKVTEKQLQIGELYLRELALRSGAPLTKRMPSGAVLAEAIDRMGTEVVRQLAQQTGIPGYDLRSWRSGRDEPTMAQRRAMFQFARDLGLDVATNPRAPRKRNGGRRRRRHRS